MFGYFKKKKEQKQAKLQQIEYAKEAFQCLLDSIKESRLLGHPCPDYALKENLQMLAVRYANKALVNQGNLSDYVRVGLCLILDYDRLQKENKPVPTEFYIANIQKTLQILQVNEK